MEHANKYKKNIDIDIDKYRYRYRYKMCCKNVVC
jgi:hypothetical protein